MVTVNWMLDEIEQPETVMALNVLEHILVGNSAAPLRKALTIRGWARGFGVVLVDGALPQGLGRRDLAGVVEDLGEEAAGGRWAGSRCTTGSTAARASP